MASGSVLHNVPIWGQPMENACWYTSYQMVVAYERSRGRGQGLSDPSEVPYVHKIYTDNNGMEPKERPKVAGMLGFVCDYTSMSVEGMLNLLSYGPIIYGGQWATGGAHVVVLVGLSENTLAYNDPLIGREFRDYGTFLSQHLYQKGYQALIYKA